MIPSGLILAASSIANGNLALHTLLPGADPAEVLANRVRFIESVGLVPARVVVAEQVHGTRVFRATSADAGRGADSAADAIPATDGLLTTEPGLPLMILGADCPLICLFDPNAPAVALVHAGWKGMAAGILKSAMAALAPTNAQAVQGFIAPHAGPCCFEVGEEVARLFPAAAIVRKPNRKPHLDFHAAAEQSLGITLRPLGTNCTICTDSHYSHRRNATPHRHALLAALTR